MDDYIYTVRRTSDRKVPKEKLPSRILQLFYNESESEPSKIPKFKSKLLHQHPNVYFIDDFLKQKELDYFDKIITTQNEAFEASFTESDNNSQVVSEERTSRFFHLAKSQDVIARNIEERASSIVGLDVQNVEPMQIVSYTNGQKFNVHHDAGTLEDDGNVTLVPPTRLITFFVYLNDLPEGQGATEFPSLELKVTPKRGSAVMFCNLLENGECDPRVAHQANPVDEGLFKYGVNIWIREKSCSDYTQQDATVNVSKIKGFDSTTSALTHAKQLTQEYQETHNTSNSNSSSSGGYDEQKRYFPYMLSLF